MKLFVPYCRLVTLASSTLICLLTLTSEITAGTISYTVRDLGTLGYDESIGWAINSSGQVVGALYGTDAAGRIEHAFLYDGSQMIDLNDSIAAGVGAGSNIALDINDKGQVVGQANCTLCPHPTKAFYYDGYSTTDIGGLSVFGSGARAISSSGFITGCSGHAFLYDGTTFRDLGTFPGGSGSSGLGVNDDGWVVGWAYGGSDGNPYGYSHAFLFDGTTMIDLTPLIGHESSLANDINSKGRVTGYVRHSAFFYKDGELTELENLTGAVSADGFGINNKDWIVGDSFFYEGTSSSSVAFMWDGENTYDLNDLVVGPNPFSLLAGARDINDAGQITGYGYVDGQKHAFLLTPVPEPDTDGDGVPDAEDQCPDSILTPTVIVDGCDSGVSNTLFPTGCSISDNGNLCAEGTGSHGEFVSCVAQYLNDLMKAKVLTGRQKGAIQACAGQAVVP